MAKDFSSRARDSNDNLFIQTENAVNNCAARAKSSHRFYFGVLTLWLNLPIFSKSILIKPIQE